MSGGHTGPRMKNWKKSSPESWEGLKMMEMRLSRSHRGWGDGECTQKSLSYYYQDGKGWFFKYHFSIFIPNK